MVALRSQENNNSCMLFRWVVFFFSLVILGVRQCVLLSSATSYHSFYQDVETSALSRYEHSHLNDPAYSFPNEDKNWQFVPAESKAIRKWGCDRTETPFIFVHIGKAGGGSVRGRLAASSHNYTRKRPMTPDMAFYPVVGEGSHGNESMTTARARFCNSCFTNRRPLMDHSYEGTQLCQASTPIGQAIGCPEIVSRHQRELERYPDACDLDGDRCDLVYAGHNIMGAEMHWLPGPYLSKWWSARWGNNNTVSPLWRRLDRNETWCPLHKVSRPQSSDGYNDAYDKCSVPLQNHVDAHATQSLSHLFAGAHGHEIKSWSPLYASMPVLRAVLVRDPFIWLLSKYSWNLDKKRPEPIKCDDIETAVQLGIKIPIDTIITDVKRIEPGWLRRMSLRYIMYLCGEDCIVRYASGTATLQDLERQAEGNLRQGFAVVGLLEDGDHVFYDMISARVQYIDASLNSHVRGADHASSKTEEIAACRQLYQDPSFQQKLMEGSPELAVLDRLYKVAKEVNTFQRTELEGCSEKSLKSE